VVVHRHGQAALGFFLANHVIVEVGLEVGRRRQTVTRALFRAFLGDFIADDVIAQVNAFVANEHRRAGNQLLDLVLALAAERAVQVFFGAGAFFVGHEMALESGDASMITKEKRR